MAADRLAVGVIGAGLIAQAVHLPTLSGLGELFSVEAIADPSERARGAARARHGVPHGYADWRDLLGDSSLDAVAICSPTGTHAEMTLAALEHGLHVFVEKPLCVTLEDAQAIVDQCATSGCTVQVGYMKRYHPGYELFLRRLPHTPGQLRFIDVLTWDPWLARAPFVTTELVLADDIPEATIEASRAALRDQVETAVGSADPESVRGFASAYLEALIHDVNLVHGALERLGEGTPAEAVVSWHTADAQAAGAMARIGPVRWQSTWLLLPGLAAFNERLSFLFEDQVHELELAAPYLRELPARCRHVESIDSIDQVTSASVPGDAYERGWRHFHACVVEGAVCRTPPEQAIADIALLRDLYLAR
jgi:hypothetical protein